MSRAQRLMSLVDLLRRHRYPVTGAVLARDLGISLRTLYRDIATLQQQGARIEGEPGLGYVLRPGFMLPPMMFSVEEIEALVLGSRWVAERGDARLRRDAEAALAKIAAVLPEDLRASLDATSLLVGPASAPRLDGIDLGLIRQAIRAERVATLHYRDERNIETTRTIWPFALGYFDHVRVLAAWCELRQDFRHFRTDRIIDLDIGEHRYPRRRQVLLKEWRDRRDISGPA